MIDPSKLPRHLAIIMDGNGRWAQEHGLPRVEGHREGAKAVRAVVRAARETGLRALTLYAFSAQNWQRPLEEIATLMQLLRDYVIDDMSMAVAKHQPSLAHFANPSNDGAAARV